MSDVEASTRLKSHDDYGDHGEEINEYLSNIHGKVSRTFEAALQQLEEGTEIHQEVRDSYLLCRIADTVEDSNLIEGRDKAELLESYSNLIEDSRSGEAGYRNVAEWVRDVSDRVEEYHLNDLDDDVEEIDGSDWSIVRNAHTAFSSYEQFNQESKETVGESVEEMAEGMAEYVEGEHGIRLKDEEDLFDYCHFAAGTVGDLLTDLFSRRADEADKSVLRESSEDYAQLLQRINIARDPVADLKDEDAIFIPEEYMENLTHEEFSDEVDEAVETDTVREEHRKLVESVEKVLESAEERADAAVEYATEFSSDESNNIRAYLETPLLLALATVNQTEPEDAFTEQGLKISRREVGKILASAGNISDEEWQDRDQLLENILKEEED